MYFRNFRILLITFVFCCGIQNITAQQDYATIRKNFNISAQGLTHELCKTKDTLILKSDQEINYVYTINSLSKRELDTHVMENFLKIPLNKFTKGRQLFVVEQNKMNIVFVVQINDNPSEIALVIEDKKIVSDN